jgi:hypothetical protein
MISIRSLSTMQGIDANDSERKDSVSCVRLWELFIVKHPVELIL